VVGGRGLSLAAARAHPANSGQPASWPAAPMALTSPPGFARRLAAGVGSARHRWVRGWGLGWAAGMGQADLATGGQGPAGLPGFLGQQPIALGRLKQSLVDFSVVEGAGGDQVVEVASRLPQLTVALAHRGGGDPVQLLDQGRPRIPFTRSTNLGGCGMAATRSPRPYGRYRSRPTRPPWS
jgi:hypothetical protein